MLLSAFLVTSIFTTPVSSNKVTLQYQSVEKISIETVLNNTTVFVASTLNVRIGSFNAGQRVTVLGTTTNNRVRVRGWYRTHEIVGYIYVSAIGWHRG